MTHQNALDIIFMHYDGELSQEASREAVLHLESCAECRQALEEWKAAKQLFFSPQENIEPPYFTERVMARLSQEEAPRRSFYDILRVYVTLPRLAAAGAAAAVIGLLLFRPFMVRNNTVNAEGTAFAAELVSGYASGTDSYSVIDEYLEQEAV